MKCQACGCTCLVLLGVLGRLRWYRCRDCGTDTYKPSRALLGA